MALDPHPDREPGMDARVVTAQGVEWARSSTEYPGQWCALNETMWPYAWADLAAAFPDATVVLP